MHEDSYSSDGDENDNDSESVVNKHGSESMKLNKNYNNKSYDD